MPSSSETGHGVNLANFNGLYEFTGALGARYAPSNEQLKRTALAQKALEARDVYDRAEAARTAYGHAVDRRSEAFAGTGRLATRLMKNLRASGAPARTIAGAETLNKKLQGVRATPPPKAVDGAEAAEARSVSQKSFDMVHANFGKLVDYLGTVPHFNPSEPELALPALRARFDTMKAANSAVAPLEAGLTEALLRRDLIFYAPGTGLVDSAKAVKDYIGSLDRRKVPAAVEAGKFKFRNYRERLAKAGLS